MLCQFQFRGLLLFGLTQNFMSNFVSSPVQLQCDNAARRDDLLELAGAHTTRSVQQLSATPNPCRIQHPAPDEYRS
jgi:hypothetical protein